MSLVLAQGNHSRLAFGHWLLDIQLQKSGNQQIIYHINNNYPKVIMDNISKQPEQLHPQHSEPINKTIQITLEFEKQKNADRMKRKCYRCGIMEDEIRYCNQTIIISFEDTNEAYCDQCLEELLAEEQEQVKKLEEQFIYQKQFQASITQADIKDLGQSGIDNEAVSLQLEVQALEQAENEVDYLLGKAKNECKELQEKVLLLQQKQQKFWSDMNKFQKRALKLQQKSFIAKNQCQNQKRTLDSLSRSNITHTFFKIQIEDNYAQVYGLMIGKKPQQLEINWEETNAGIGHLLLAYNYLILKYGLTYTRIENIRLKGHLSEILLRNSDAYYPVGLGVSNGNVTCNEKMFGIMIQSLLAEMADLAQHIQEIENIEYSEELKLPFIIDKKEGKILDLYVNPIKLEQKTKWTQWTKAMRYFLIDFKHILTISSLSDPYL